MADRMRVLQLIYSFGIEGGGGGIGRFVLALSRRLDPGRFEVSIGALFHLGTDYEQRWIDQLNAEGIGAFAAADYDSQRPYASFWQALRRLRARLVRAPVQVLHSHSEFTDVAVLLLKLSRRKTRILRTVHYGFRYEWRKRPLRRLVFTHLLYPLIYNAEVGVSQTIAGNLSRRPLSRLLGRRGLCLYNAIDLERFAQVRVDRGAKRAELGLPAQAPVFGSVGRLTEQKGYPYLIQAAAHALEQMPEARCLLIGEGEQAEMLRAQAESLKIGPQVVFTGPRRDIEELLPCMDLFVSSSLWEGLPTVIMESMASGTPVLATDIPGTTELVQPGDNGWLVPAGDGTALGEGILRALADPGLRQQMAERARQTVGQFSIQAVASRYEALYRALLDASSRPLAEAQDRL